MIVAHHLIFGAYGFWLPNDPRGSWSEFVGSADVFLFGPATTTTEPRSLAHRQHDRSRRRAAKAALQRPPVAFNPAQAQAVGTGLGEYATRSGLPVWACAVMADHVHVVVKQWPLQISQVATQLKGAAVRALIAAELHPFAAEPDSRGRLPKCFARGEWSVFLEDREDVARAVKYVENNPVRDGKPRQTWEFVVPWE